jgi:glycosyltransferase involved in cell wall biosynthesis
MKVCLVSPHCPSDDAIGEYSAHMAAELCKKASVVVLANQNSNSPTASTIQPNGDSFNYYTVLRIWKSGLLYPFKIFRGIIRQKPDIVHIQHEYFLYGKGYSGILFPILLLLVRLSQVPLIVTMHHVIPLAEAGHIRKLLKTPIPEISIKMFLTFFNRLFSFSSKIIVPSDAFKQTLSNDYKISSGQIEIVPHFVQSYIGPESSSFVEKDSENAKVRLGLGNRKVVLFFGYIRPPKGIEYVLFGLRDVIKAVPNVMFSIIGKAQPNYGSYFDHIQQLVNELELSKYVRFENHVPEESLPLFFAASDAVIFPYTSTIGMTPIAHLKVASYGKPIIATNIDSFSKEFIDGENALLIPPKDPDAIGKSIIEVFTDADLSRKLSKNITLYCSQRSQEKAVDRTIEIYLDVIGGKKRY